MSSWIIVSAVSSVSGVPRFASSVVTHSLPRSHRQKEIESWQVSLEELEGTFPSRSKQYVVFGIGFFGLTQMRLTRKMLGKWRGSTALPRDALSRHMAPAGLRVTCCKIERTSFHISFAYLSRFPSKRNDLKTGTKFGGRFAISAPFCPMLSICPIPRQKRLKVHASKRKYYKSSKVWSKHSLNTVRILMKTQFHSYPNIRMSLKLRQWHCGASRPSNACRTHVGVV